MSKQNRAAHVSPLPAGIVELSVHRPPHISHATPDFLAEEVPVALVYNGISHVVMMASPKDLELFAIGFSLSEGIIAHPQEIYGMDVVQACNGLEVQIELSSRRFMGLKERRRALAGRTGCGVCGVEQLNDIGKPVAPLPFTQTFNLGNLDKALEHLNDVQPIGQLSGCTHAAAWVLPSGEIVGGHEDVGRHVALDKLLGRRALTWARQERASQRSAQGKPSVDHADIPQDEQQRILRKLFDRFYEETVEEGSFLFPDVAETLSALHAKGIPLGLVTNKPTPFVAPLLEALDIARKAYPAPGS